MPGSPKNPAISAVTALIGKRIPVNPEIRFSSHRQMKPEAVLTPIFHARLRGVMHSRRKQYTNITGIARLRKDSIFYLRIVVIQPDIIAVERKGI